MSKFISIFLILIVTTTTLTGCFDSEQLNERMLVQAVGIDLIDGEIEITLQVYAPATQGGSGISATPDNAKIVTATGQTVTQAMQNATLMQGKTVFMGHNRVIVLGNDLAKEGITSALDYFSSNATSRHNINVIIATEKASDILTTKINQGIVPAETIEKMITRANEIGVLKNVKLYELLSTLQNDFESATLPMLEVMSEPETKQASTEPSSAEETGENSTQSIENELDTISNIKVYGTAIITDSKLQNELTTDETRGLLFILNEVKKTTYTVQTYDYTTASLQIYSTKSKITPTFQDGQIHFNLEINAQAQLGQKELAPNKETNESSLKTLEKAVAHKIETECLQAYTKAVLESKADIFEFGNIIWQRNPNIWKNQKDNWLENTNNLTFTPNCNVTINRIGL